MSDYGIGDIIADGYQNRRIRELGEQLEVARWSARSDARRLTSDLSKLKGSIESRLIKLAEAFDAFVELSDLRAELLAFTSAAEIRQYASVVLAALTSPDGPPRSSDLLPELLPEVLAPPPDVPGYWLGPAATALLEFVAGADGIPEPAAEALRRDEAGAAAFFCVAMPLVGCGDRVQVAWLDACLSRASDFSRTAENLVGVTSGAEQEVPSGAVQPVTILRRALWTAAAGGAYGRAGAKVAERWLADQLARSAPVPGDWLNVLAPQPSIGMAALPDDVNAQVRAAARLTRLREGCERFASAADADAASVGASDGAGRDIGGDVLGDLVRFYLFEGSTPERDLLARARELRSKISEEEKNTAVLPYGKIRNGSSGTINELALSDLRGENKSLAGLAFRAGVPIIREGAQGLAETASGEAPSRITVRMDGFDIALRPDGVEQTSLDAAEAKIRAAAPFTPRPRTAAYVALGGGVISIALVFVHWVFLVLGVALLVVGGVVLRNVLAGNRNGLSYSQGRIERGTTDLRKRVESAEADFTSYVQESDDRIARATADLDVILQVPGR